MAEHNREVLLLIIKQLQFYGLNSVASVVAEATGIPNKVDPSPKLAQLIAIANTHTENNDVGEYDDDEAERLARSLDLDDTTRTASKYPPPRFTSCFTASHKGSARTAAFSLDGRLVATGSADTSLKVLDVAKMNLHLENAEERPVVRTLYDHNASVNELAFHPNGILLASCSKDSTIKFFDLTRPSVKQAFRFIKDSCNVRSIAFHPSGDFLIAGTDHEVIRLYELSNFSSYCSSHPQDHHRGQINQVKFSNSGHYYASCSKDGSWKLWDGVTSSCIMTVQAAHLGSEVSSIRFSANGKYVLTSGKNKESCVRLWETSSGKLVKVYEGARQQYLRVQASFTFDEEFVISGDEATNNVVIWDARSSAVLSRFSGHTSAIRWLTTSPVNTGLVSCGEDSRVTYWNNLATSAPIES